MDNNFKKIKIGEMEFIRLKGGKFRMGAIGGDDYSTTLEKNRDIKLDTFLIQSTPVTVGQYYSFLKDAGYESNYKIEVWDGNDWVVGPNFSEINGKGDDYPVVGVSFLDAEKYIEWISKKLNKTIKDVKICYFKVNNHCACLKLTNSSVNLYV